MMPQTTTSDIPVIREGEPVPEGVTTYVVRDDKDIYYPVSEGRRPYHIEGDGSGLGFTCSAFVWFDADSIRAAVQKGDLTPAKKYFWGVSREEALSQYAAILPFGLIKVSCHRESLSSMNRIKLTGNYDILLAVIVGPLPHNGAYFTDLRGNCMSTQMKQLNAINVHIRAYLEEPEHSLIARLLKEQDAGREGQ